MIETILQSATIEAIQSLYGVVVPFTDIQVQETSRDYPGDLTIVVFPLLKYSRKSPEQTANDLGALLKSQLPEIESYTIVKGFLNLRLTDSFLVHTLMPENAEYWQHTANHKSVMVEYASPNTNKPLHLGHVRNILLGYSMAAILEARGNTVIRANLINDRGIHICKSMLAWQKWGNGETPDSGGMKGDHLAGKYYVRFEQALQAEATPLLDQVYADNLENIEKNNRLRVQTLLKAMEEASDIEKQQTIQNDIKEIVRNNTPLMRQAQEMLRQWEAGNPEVIHTWQMMNTWVYEGFGETYKALGISFDQIYYESKTYILGKEIVQQGLEKGVFYRKEDGSVWVDLADEGLDEKLLLRGDGTSVYITQDLGTAEQRFDTFHLDQHIYVVGNEQEYHFKALKAIFKKLGKPWWNTIFHLSYGMVELPSGKMKSREGTVVDADDLIAGMIEQAREETAKLGKIAEMPEDERAELYRKIALAALKFYILKADPKKQMLFNPAESIDLHGFTGPYIQYVYARIKSILRKATDEPNLPSAGLPPLQKEERELLQQLYKRNNILETAAQNLSPAIIANYVYETARIFNRFYDQCPVLNINDSRIRQNRLLIVEHTAACIKRCCELLGIEVVERM